MDVYRAIVILNERNQKTKARVHTVYIGLLLLCMILKFVHYAFCNSILYFLIAEEYSIVWIHHKWFISFHLLFMSFTVLMVKNKAAMFLNGHMLSFLLDKYLRVEWAVSCGQCICHFLRNY